MSYPGPTYHFDEEVARRILEVAAQEESEILVIRERDGRDGSDEPDYLVTGLTAMGRRTYRTRALG